jgi:AcrR family transcriptional regulator
MARQIPPDPRRGGRARPTVPPRRERPGGLDSKEAIRQYVAEIVNEKLNEKLDQHAAKVSAKAERHLDALDRMAGHMDVLDVWTRAEPRTRRPRFSRDEIAAAAIRIADTEGFEAVSMRRIAADLGAGTMTLYHYVRTKDELLTLVTDAVMAEVVVPDGELPDDWRAALVVLAHRSRAAVMAHSWMLDIHDDPPVGPNSVRHFDQSFGAVVDLPATLAQKIEIIMAVDEYVFGYCLHERNNTQSDDGLAAGMRDYINELVSTGEYPNLSRLVDEHGFDTAWRQLDAAQHDDARFDRNLGRLLDGFEREMGL